MSEEPTTHRFEAEVEQVLRLVIESLYSNREVFLRELVSNAADALDKLRFAAVTEPALLPEGETLEIRLIPDREAKTLTLWDNGVGMSHDELVQNLGTIARSGTRELVEKLREAKESGDLSLIGQFGVGFYSSYLVADRVEVVSRAAGSDEAHRWSSEAKDSFTIEPAERDSQGTSIVLHLGEAHETFLDPVTLRQLVSRYSDYLSWPVKLRTLKKVDDDYEESLETINSGQALWHRKKDDVTDEAAHDLYRHLTSDFEAPLAWRQFKLEGMVQFAGAIFIPKHAPMSLYMPDHSHGMRLYVKRVFIMDDAEALLPRWLRFVRGVVDSEDLPLNVSREILQDSRLVSTIQKQVVKQTLDLLAEVAEERPEDYATLWTAFGGILKEGLHDDPGRADSFAPLLRFESSAVEGLTSLAEAKERMLEGQKALYYVLGESKRQVETSPHTEGLRAAGFEVLYLTDPVDPFAITALREFDGVDLVSAGDAELELEGEEVDASREAELSDLSTRFRTRLQDHVSEVRVSTRLKDSAVCLVVPEGGLMPHMERLLRATQQGMPAQKRILELNPEHPVIENLRKRLETSTGVEEVDAHIELLYEMAQIAEGSPIEDPARFNQRVIDLLKGATAL